MSVFLNIFTKNWFLFKEQTFFPRWLCEATLKPIVVYILFYCIISIIVSGQITKHFQFQFCNLFSFLLLYSILSLFLVIIVFFLYFLLFLWSCSLSYIMTFHNYFLFVFPFQSYSSFYFDMRPKQGQFYHNIS